MGKFFVFCRIKLKFCSWLYIKRWHTSWTFQLEITSNKQVIAKKPLTNLYEMNSNWMCVVVVPDLQISAINSMCISKRNIFFSSKYFDVPTHLIYIWRKIPIHGHTTVLGYGSMEWLCLDEILLVTGIMFCVWALWMNEWRCDCAYNRRVISS